jgi:hypothetical protein
MEFGIGIYGVWYRYLWSLVSVFMEFGIGIANFFDFGSPEEFL